LDYKVEFLNSYLENRQPFYRPAQIILLRHAEKPAEGPFLSELGQRRANLLPLLFKQHPLLIAFGSPVAIFAASPKNIGSSIRSIQTMIPLAKDLKITINEDFKKYEITKLIDSILRTPNFHGKTIIICWERSRLPLIAKVLGAKNTPLIWSKESYDRCWILKLSDKNDPEYLEIIQNFDLN
jgi:hypothetical protein